MLFQKVEILMIFGVDKRALTWGVHWQGIRLFLGRDFLPQAQIAIANPS